MKLSSFSPAVATYELDLNYYHGKDIVHEGNMLHLNPAIAWPKVSKTTRHNIKKASTLKDLAIKQVKGTKKDLNDFRSIWFDPSNSSLPTTLKSNEVMYMAYLNKALVAGMILTPSGNNLYLHYMAGTPKARESNINSYIIWHAVNELKDSSYAFIDIGVSFRKSLYTFFKHWQTESYPIIFEPPYLLPQIRLTPFENKDILGYSQSKMKKNQKLLEQNFSENFTILPKGTYAIKAILTHLNLTKEYNVAVYTSFNTSYLSRCVSEPIESLSKISRKINNKTKAVVVIHEFGYPYKKILELKKECKIRQIPLIEDCAWGWQSSINNKYKIGEIGDYAIFSLPKIFPMQYGAILKGLTIPDEVNWKEYGLLDYYKREIITQQLSHYLPSATEVANKKRSNFLYLEKYFENDGYNVLEKLDPDTVPATILVLMKNKKEMDEVADRYITFGIEVGKYYPKNAIFLPIHQNLDKNQLDYVYAVFRGYLNLCKDYKRQ